MSFVINVLDWVPWHSNSLWASLYKPLLSGTGAEEQWHQPNHPYYSWFDPNVVLLGQKGIMAHSCLCFGGFLSWTTRLMFCLNISIGIRPGLWLSHSRMHHFICIFCRLAEPSFCGGSVHRRMSLTLTFSSTVSCYNPNIHFYIKWWQAALVSYQLWYCHHHVSKLGWCSHSGLPCFLQFC